MLAINTIGCTRNLVKNYANLHLNKVLYINIIQRNGIFVLRTSVENDS